MQFLKTPIPIARKVSGNSEVRGVSKAKVLEESMKVNWNFQKGGRVKTKKKPSGRDMDIFWDKITKHELSTIEKEVISLLFMKCCRQDRYKSRELTYWYEAMVSFIVRNEYTVQSNRLEIKKYQ